MDSDMTVRFIELLFYRMNSSFSPIFINWITGLDRWLRSHITNTSDSKEKEP